MRVCPSSGPSWPLLVLVLGLLLLPWGCSSGNGRVKVEEEKGKQFEVVEEEVPDQDLGQLMFAPKVTNIRAGRSKASSVIGRLRPGQRVRAHFLENDWYAIFPPEEAQIKLENRLGYVQASLLKPLSAGEWGEIKEVRAPMDLRQARTTRSNIVARLRAGQKVKVGLLEKEWYAVFDPNEAEQSEENALGYVQASLLGPVPVLAGEWGEIKLVPATMNIRQARTTKSKIVGKLRAGQKVKLGLLEKDWYAVFDPNATEENEEDARGYVHALLLRPLSTWERGEVRVVRAKMNLRQARTKKSKIVSKLRAGQKVKLGLLENDWYAVFAPGETQLSEKKALGYGYAPLLRDASSKRK